MLTARRRAGKAVPRRNTAAALVCQRSDRRINDSADGLNPENNANHEGIRANLHLAEFCRHRIGFRVIFPEWIPRDREQGGLDERCENATIADGRRDRSNP